MSNLEDEKVEFKGITYINHECDNPELLQELPDEMRSFIKKSMDLLLIMVDFKSEVVVPLQHGIH